MGYNTQYSLEADLLIGNKVAELVDNTPLKLVIEELIDENENAQYCMTRDGEATQECKWYEHEADLKAFSKKHPGILFTLRGEGEKSGDLWAKYFLNGKVHVAKAEFTIEAFNSKKLV